MTHTLSGMAMAVPLAVAAPAALSSDAVSRAFAMDDSTKMLPTGVQRHCAQQWRLPVRVYVGGYRDLTLAEWYGTPYHNTDHFQKITDIGITPVFLSQDSSRSGWYLEYGIGAHPLSAAYNDSWRRRSVAYEFGDHIGAGHVPKSTVDAGLLLQHFPNGGIKLPNNGVNFAMLRTNKVTWTWTQTT
jgi:lipid A 3-O-deacylase